MVVRDGICYPDAPMRHVKIVAAENVGDHLLHVRFDDGDLRLFDGRTLVGEVFAPLTISVVMRSVCGAAIRPMMPPSEKP